MAQLNRTVEEVNRLLDETAKHLHSGYAAFDFATLREKIGSGRTQDDLDAFGLTDEVWTGIMAADIMVVRDDQRERTYIVTGSSDYYISFAYGMGGDYEGWEIRRSGDSFTITVGLMPLHVALTQDEYDRLEQKNDNTYYYVFE